MKRCFLTLVAIAGLFTASAANVSCSSDSSTASSKAVAATSEPYTHIQASERFVLYQTTNHWNLLELDTRTGEVWQVQYVVNEGDRFKEKIVSSRLGIYDDVATAPDGRFILYPTHNNYNFLLLDKQKGNVWQVQWSVDEDSYQGVIAEIY
mgnify:CR=1 FL=1